MEKKVYEVENMGKKVKIKTIKEVKVCGIWYCNDRAREYKLNIMEKINKMESNLKLWKHRNLTFEGKSLVIKTFGLSQLIYVLQTYRITDESISHLS